MTQTIVPGGNGDTPVVVADKVRALPANQGLNNNALWALITTELAAAATAATLINNYESYGVAGVSYGNT